MRIILTILSKKIGYFYAFFHSIAITCRPLLNERNYLVQVQLRNEALVKATLLTPTRYLVKINGR